MNKNYFWRLLGGLVICFAMPWVVLIMGPYISEATIEPVPYAEADEVEGVPQYPDRSNTRFGSSDFGAKVYASEGCAYCHTQMVRPHLRRAGYVACWVGRT